LRQIQKRRLVLGKVDDISRGGQLGRDLFGRFDTSEFDQTFAGLRQGLGDQLCGLGVTLGVDDRSLFRLFRLFNQESESRIEDLR
jgi:hypothetical protein